jgi:exodeoxyribonuclease V alpha subunit
MHGGVKVYRGTAAAARNYVEADRSRADDYYLVEGMGVARRYAAGPDRPVVELASLTGDGYEAWVAGLDPETGQPRGRLRADASAVRFVEVVVNGPKSWSLAAELHPNVAAAYEKAQDRAAEQIISWLAEHATTRVGPRGAQVAVPVEALEAVTVRHYTSRAGDPHRHVHMQVNARVLAAGTWRGLDTVAVRDSIAAINGIGHAAVVCDPEFRAALAAHGYTLNEAGEIEQLATFVGAFSKRAAQIAALLDRYEADWRREHPGAEPGPQLRRAWDARAWAEDRPDKVVPRRGAELRQLWLGELAELGYRDRDKPIQLDREMPAQIDRDAAAADVVARLGAARSAWNAADVRGQVEQLLTRAGIVADQAVRGEVAEDLTARAVELCVPLRETATPGHIRALSSRHVLDVEADLVAWLAARGGPAESSVAPAVEGLDAGQWAGVAALAGDARLVVVEGAAGAGKTTLLAAARDQLDRQGRRLVVVTPTLKAAQAATAEVGARAGSAAWLAWQHGWRWDATGAWSRTPTGPARDAVLQRRDLLLVDEAGMLDQDTARALLTIADETGARLALVGDRHQLPAVGRGGVLDLALRWVHPDARVDLDAVYRFVHTVGGHTIPDSDYAQLTLEMRAGDDPGAVFDALHAGGRIAVHGSDVRRCDALADHIVATRLDGGRTATVVVDTREHAATLNSAIRDRLVAAGAVDDRRVAVTRDGQRLGAGDVIVTRRNEHDLGVANREVWTVTRVHRDGRLTVDDSERGRRELSADYVRGHVELGYAVTGYGAQGDTGTEAHLVLTETTTAPAAYVAMTRGRVSNTAHLVAADLDDAREQWIAAFGRDRADLGPAAAGQAAARAAAGYRTPRPLSEVLTELRTAWTEQLTAHRHLERLEEHLDQVQAQAAWEAHCHRALAPFETACAAARTALERADQAATGCAAVLTDRADHHAAALRQTWDTQLVHAEHAAQTIAAGPGRLGIHRGRVRNAQQHLDTWKATWSPVFTGSDLDPHRIAARPIAFGSHVQRVTHALGEHARRLAAADRPDEASRLHAAHLAREQYHAAAAAYHQTRHNLQQRSHLPLYATGAASQLPELTKRVQDAQHRVRSADQLIERLTNDPAITRHPNPRALLQHAHTGWATEQAAAHQQAASRTPGLVRSIRHDPAPIHHVDHGPSLGR